MVTNTTGPRIEAVMEMLYLLTPYIVLTNSIMPQDTGKGNKTQSKLLVSMNCLDTSKLLRQVKIWKLIP